MKTRFTLFFCAVGLAFGSSIPVKAQVTHQVVDEVVAQVNDDVITWSRLQSEIRRRVEALKKMGWSERHATDEIAKHRAELVATLVDEQLLFQKGKELELSEKVENEVNRRLALTTTPKPDSLAQESAEEIRASLRTAIMIESVFAQEVDSPLFASFSLEDLQAYFAAHKDKFLVVETVTLSEIFLSSAGKDEAQVKAKADQLVTRLRDGADFATLAAANSDRDEEGKHSAPTKGGKVGTFELPSLREDIAAGILNIKEGAVSDPLKTNGGYQILRVDARTPAGAPAFKQSRVREAMTAERSAKAHEEYLQHLRAEAYIRIAKNYEAAVVAPER